MRALAQATDMTYEGGQLSQRDRHQQQPRHPRENTYYRDRNTYYHDMQLTITMITVRSENGGRNWTFGRESGNRDRQRNRSLHRDYRYNHDTGNRDMTNI